MNVRVRKMTAKKPKSTCDLTTYEVWEWFLFSTESTSSAIMIAEDLTKAEALDLIGGIN